MPRALRLMDYRPNPQHLRLVITPKSWAVYVSPLATVIDVAIVMNAFGCVLDHKKPETLADGFFMHPREETVPPPTAQEFAALLARGFDSSRDLPMRLRNAAAL